MKKLIVIALLGALIISAHAENRAAWMQDAKWGVMIHYQPEWLAEQNQLDPINIDEWNKLVDNFDCEGLAKQLSDAGAGYLIMTVRHGPPFFISPNSMYDHYTGQVPSRCSRRDLVADLSDALTPYGIKLIVYFTGHAPNRTEAEIEGFALGRSDYYKAGPFQRNAESLLRWQEVLREYSMRWGDKVSGWWLDGCYRPNITYRQPDIPNFASLAAAVRAGNTNSIVAFNPGRFPRIMSITPYEDYTAGEINEPERILFKYNYDGMVDGKQIHILSYLGATWGQGEPRFTDEQVVQHSLKVTEVGGAITWDCPVYPNGLIKEPFMKQLRVIGEAVN